MNPDMLDRFTRFIFKRASMKIMPKRFRGMDPDLLGPKAVRSTLANSQMQVDTPPFILATLADERHETRFPVGRQPTGQLFCSQVILELILFSTSESI